MPTNCDNICELFIEPRTLIHGTTGGDDTRRAEQERKFNSHANNYWGKLIKGGAKFYRITGSQDLVWMTVEA